MGDLNARNRALRLNETASRCAHGFNMGIGPEARVMAGEIRPRASTAVGFGHHQASPADRA